MALVSGERSTLNPDAPLFIPAVFRQVEDFSPEWWELVKTSTWFRDYWIDQHQHEETFDGYVEEGFGDIVKFLPESIDLGMDEDFPNLEAQLEELIQYPNADEANQSVILGSQKEKTKNGLEMDLNGLVKNQS